MTQVILHIGTHKTGTTAIQQFLHDNADLLEHRGVRFFLMPARYKATTPMRNASFLVRCLRERLGTKKLEDDVFQKNKKNLEAFQREVAKGGIIILSDEQLWLEFAHYQDSIAEAKNLLVECGVSSVQVIVYLRRQDDFIVSLWNQRVKNVMRVSIPATRYVRRKVSRLYMDYARTVKALRDVFGAENVIVRVYDRSSFEEGDVRRDFCTCIGIDPDVEFVFSEGEPNPALSNNLADVKRHANSVKAYREGANFLMGPAISATERVGRDATSPITPDERLAILDRYAEGNSWIAREVLGREDGVLFAQPEEFPAMWEMDPNTYSRDMILFFTEALTAERNYRLEAERRIADLERRMKVFERHERDLGRRNADLESRLAKLERKAEGLNASLGPLARARRKLWRRRQSRS